MIDTKQKDFLHIIAGILIFHGVTQYAEQYGWLGQYPWAWILIGGGIIYSLRGK